MMAPDAEEIKTRTRVTPELLQYILDESTLFALLDKGNRILWIREESELAVENDFFDYFELELKNDHYFSLKDGKCFTIEELPDQNYRIVKLEKAYVDNDIKGLAHDFNNIFSSMLNQLDHLKDKLSNDPENFRAIDSIERQAMRATEILESALNKKEPKKLKQKIKPELLFDEILEVLKNELPEKHSIVKDVTFEHTISIIRSELYRSLLNIVKNAIEASDKEKFILKFSVREEKKRVLLEIEDNGKGISPENITKVFKQGFSTKSRLVDSGIGLATTKAVIEKEGGEIFVESEVNKYTRFTLSFPLPRILTSKDKTEKPIILIADDENDMRELLAELFIDSGYIVIQANNGLDAYSEYEENTQIELLIVDKKMPVSDGFEFIEKVRKNDDETPIILASGSLKESEQRLLPLLNINRVLEKPYKFEELLKQTEELINT